MKQGRVEALAFGCVALLLAGCADRPGGPDRVTKTEFPGATTDVIMPTPRDLTCNPAASSERMPARAAATAATGEGSAGTTYFTNDLFSLFRSICGGCHVESSLGGFNVSAGTFAQQVTQQLVDMRIKSNDPSTFMPPAAAGGVPFDHRDMNDPVVQLASLLELWIAQGSPAGAFTVDSGTGTGTGTGDYTLSPALGGQLTNIGSCVPGADLYAMDTSDMDRLDAFFAAATELPETLADTDLTTLDSEKLARSGVISYAPAYPLWSDGSGKMRYVRVPRGHSVAFDQATQKFSIPPNTRFYKTFLKKIVDVDGNQSYRKIETRLIVSRPDQDQPDGTVKQTALFGTYVWNSDETQATLLADPLRNGKPFRDRLISYITDEPRAQAVIDSVPPGDNVDYALEVQNKGLVRHYAIPGSERCVQCHMGSPAAAFVLGFTPLQVARHPMGTSGVIEPATGDELTQLDRLIKYGVISGLASADDIVPLERSQGTRAPRNDYELRAQAYLLGNCSHCHNPRGFPSMKAPELKNVLNFLPGPDGGIFQFPLERTSPVRQRGPNQDIPIPYITPALKDLPEPGSDPKLFCPDGPGGACGSTGSTANIAWIDAPWRSLIYRNVDTPFDYVEDRTIFPHMPLNSAGYDCRVAPIVGDWMVSIPAVLIHPDLDLNARPDAITGTYPPDANMDPQPYMEVPPGDPGYADAVRVAGLRLNQYHGGRRYAFCPDTSDILDPFIVDQVSQNKSVTPDTAEIYDPADPTKVILPNLGIPIRPHWVVTDATEPPGDWFPRRPDWSTALIDHMAVGSGVNPEDLEDLVDVIQALENVTLTPDVKSALLQEVPFGLWKQKAGCNFGGVPTAGTFTGASRPMWMDVVQAPADAPVYVQSAGAALFTSICFNCHGPQADAKGLLADEITLMTGGDARVADLRDGLFGPLAMPGANRARIFGTAAAQLGGGVTADDLGARYLAWMALGGTAKHLPQTILDQVALSPVLGAYRGPKLELAGSPDMLRLGLKLCSEMLPSEQPNVVSMSLTRFVASGWEDWGAKTGLIDRNGDAEMWLRLCNLGNRPVVRVVFPGNPEASAGSLYWGDDYPATAPAMDQHGRVTSGIAADNYFPVCARGAPGPAVGAAGAVIPACPSMLTDTVDASGNKKYLLKTVTTSVGPDYVDARKWAARGAINAALAVFLYLDGVERGTVTPKPPFDQCEKR